MTEGTKLVVLTDTAEYNRSAERKPASLTKELLHQRSRTHVEIPPRPGPLRPSMLSDNWALADCTCMVMREAGREPSLVLHGWHLHAVVPYLAAQPVHRRWRDWIRFGTYHRVVCLQYKLSLAREVWMTGVFKPSGASTLENFHSERA